MEKTKKLLPVLVFILILSISGCGLSLAIDRDFDPGYSYKNIKFYKWKMIKYPRHGASRVNRFKRAINEQMAKMGFEESIEKPDFEILIRGFTKEKTNMTTMGYSYGRYWGGTNVYVSLSKEGTVVIELIDMKKKEVFWQGVVEGTVEEDLSSTEMRKKYAEIAEELFSDFPLGE